MSTRRGVLVTALAVLVAGGSLTAISKAQEGRPPPINSQTPVIQPRNSSADWRLLHAGNSTYRYNSRNGETQVLSVTSQSVGIGYSWTSATEASGAPTLGNPGRYEVGVGDNQVGPFIRIDTNLGTTWTGSMVGGNIRWDIVK